MLIILTSCPNSLFSVSAAPEGFAMSLARGFPNQQFRFPFIAYYTKDNGILIARIYCEQSHNIQATKEVTFRELKFESFFKRNGNNTKAKESYETKFRQ